MPWNALGLVLVVRTLSPLCGQNLFVSVSRATMHAIGCHAVAITRVASFDGSSLHGGEPFPPCFDVPFAFATGFDAAAFDAAAFDFFGAILKHNTRGSAKANCCMRFAEFAESGTPNRCCICGGGVDGHARAGSVLGSASKSVISLCCCFARKTNNKYFVVVSDHCCCCCAQTVPDSKGHR